MEFSGMEQMWKLQEGGSGDTFRRDAEQTVQRMERARKWQRVILAFCAAITLASTVFVGVAAIQKSSVDWREAWPVGLLQAGAILTVTILWRARMRRQRGFERCGASVRQAMEWALADIRKQIREAKILAGWALVVVPLLAVQLAMLHASGKMNAQAITSFSFLCVAILGINAIVFGRRYRKTLRPERERLAAILQEMEA